MNKLQSGGEPQILNRTKSGMKEITKDDLPFHWRVDWSCRTTNRDYYSRGCWFKREQTLTAVVECTKEWRGGHSGRKLDSSARDGSTTSKWESSWRQCRARIQAAISNGWIIYIWLMPIYFYRTRAVSIRKASCASHSSQAYLVLTLFLCHRKNDSSHDQRKKRNLVQQ
jgi:hypothetical protein